MIWGIVGCCETIATVPTYIYLVLSVVQYWQVCHDHFRVLIDEACWVESEGVACRAAKHGAIPQLMECPVKLQSARSTPGSVAAGLLMCRL
jgi:hypothetical protein